MTRLHFETPTLLIDRHVMIMHTSRRTRSTLMSSQSRRMKLASHVKNFRHFGFRNFQRKRPPQEAPAHTIPGSSMDLGTKTEEGLVRLQA